jgi:hypothetical protein
MINSKGKSISVEKTFVVNPQDIRTFLLEKIVK